MTKKLHNSKIKNNIEEKSASLIVEIPKIIKIKLVQATNLNLYELSHIFLTLFATACIGFWVGYYSAPIDGRDNTLKVIALVFSVFTILFLISTILLRWQLHKNAKSISVSKTVLELK